MLICDAFDLPLNLNELIHCSDLLNADTLYAKPLWQSGFPQYFYYNFFVFNTFACLVELFIKGTDFFYLYPHSLIYYIKHYKLKY